MKPIQFLLIVILLALVGDVWLSRHRSTRFNRLIVLGMVIAGIVMVLLPDLTTDIASILGVGRGTDLLVYLAVVAVAFILWLLYAKVRALEETITSIVRTIALEQAHYPPREDVGDPDIAEHQP